MILLDTRPPDFLGRVPIPLRLPFKAGIDRCVARHRSASGESLLAESLTGGGWLGPFAAVMGRDSADRLPAMLAVTCSAELLSSRLQHFYQCGPLLPEAGYNPRCHDAGLLDPQGIFHLYGLIPFVMLVDEARLAGRPVPESWADLLLPDYRGQIVFGGWRAHPDEPFVECNRFLLLSLQQAFGPAGVRAFARNVLGLRHHIQLARDFGKPGHPECGAIAILPWSQASLCPQRQGTRIVWPREGAYTMPMAFMLQSRARARLQPLIDHLTGDELAALLWQNGYPSAFAGPGDYWPAEARLSWLGWPRVRSQDMAAQSEYAVQNFFGNWRPGLREETCN